MKTSGFKLIGIRLDGKTTNHQQQSAHDCGALWQQFERDNVFDRIPGKVSDAVYGVYHDYDSDENGPFAYFIGCKTAPDAQAPEGLYELLIPEQTYRLFQARGKMTGCITAVWEEIWRSGISRSFGYDFEVYDERSLDWSDAEVDVYLSVPGQADPA